MSEFAGDDSADDAASVASDESCRFETVQISDTEEPEFYRKDGFHPIHIGDHLDGGRYRIVHKLGHGGFSVVWLAYDSLESIWVALKIVAASDSSLVEEKAVMCHSIISKMDDERFVTYKRFFHIEGPNGRHLCLVLPPCGPSCNTMSQYLQSFLAPEVAVGKPASPASDVWALGCSILQIRSGSSPFSIPNVDSPANLLGWVSEYLGCMPASWGEPLFDDDGLPTTDTANGEPLGEVLEYTRSLTQWIRDIWDQPENLEELQSASTAPERVKDENKPYLECYSNKFWKPAAIRIDNVYLGAYSDKVDKIIESLPKISTQEVDLLSDLISKIFVYEPAQRVSARDILAHPWFHMVDTI
ncbi:CMGC SRPK kinase [Fusarium agapanthi]|uniref:non-specific serine/threonine protein kinase n=1 Tax=Fusarium agapanthi TaxID=1803897 RepID=A0A9P5BD13_9HYPO|nr:CMGC SRPK kinase [Fusarium agapanthi]